MITPSKTAASILPLALEDVSFEAGGKRLIKDFTCRFESGPRTVIIGANGAGKSLLMRLCHGLVRPSAGHIAWLGAEENGVDAAPHQAMVFQRPVMLRRSGAANVDYALKLKGVARGDRRARVDEALTRTGLHRLAGTQARVLSIGEQQKLALARVWALGPELLFLDEPTASLDPAATHEIEELIQGLHAAGTRIILTTHDLAQARRIADEVIFIHRGRLVEQAPAESFFERPREALAGAFLRGELLWWDDDEADSARRASRDDPRTLH